MKEEKPLKKIKPIEPEVEISKDSTTDKELIKKENPAPEGPGIK